jgi:hypothetical protein
MARCKVDPAIERVEVDGFPFPLGVYPVEPLKARAGYTLAFEPADGDESGSGPGREQGEPLGESDNEFESGLSDSFGGGLDGEPSHGGNEWEEWPDRYVFDILVPTTRVEPLFRALFALMPGRIFPILDVLGHDEYREVDPYVSYDLLGTDRFIDAIRRFRGFFYEDGLVGFGAMSDQPFLYIFVDEHKILTVRAEVPLRERIEQILAAFDLEQIEEISGADSVTHEHRSVLEAPHERMDLLSADEIVEELQEEWRLELNVNPETNVDEEGNDLGMTGWRCLVRVDPPPPEQAMLPEPSNEPAPSPTEELASKAGQVPLASTEPTGEVSGPPSESPSDAALVTTVLPPSRYAEVLLTADSLLSSQDLALQAIMDLPGGETDLAWLELGGEPFIVMLTADRLRPENFSKAVREATDKTPNLAEARIWHAAWVA